MRDRPPSDLNEGSAPEAYVPDLRRCETCGQTYDHNHMGQMYHHEMSGRHEPIAP